MRRTPKRRQWPAALIFAVLLAACDTIAVPSPPADELAAPTIIAPTSSAQAPAPTALPPALPAPALLLRALHERENGDYDAVGLDLRALLDAYPDQRLARRMICTPARCF